MYARKIAQLAPINDRRHMRRGCGTLSYRRNRKRSRKAPVVREIQISRHRQLFLLFLFVVSQFFFLQASMFEVRDVSVQGGKEISESTIRKAMNLPEGSRYWDISPAALQTDILELNGLETATVNVLFPGRVAVSVSEREPVFTVASLARTAHPFTVDKEGVILAEGKGPKGSLLIILGRSPRIGGRLSAAELEVCNYLRTHLRPAVAARLEHVRFGERGEVTLRLKYRDGIIPVRLGQPEKLSYKLFLLEELIASLKAESAVVVSIDLRFSTPIVRQPFAKPTPVEGETPPE